MLNFLGLNFLLNEKNKNQKHTNLKKGPPFGRGLIISCFYSQIASGNYIITGKLLPIPLLLPSTVQVGLEYVAWKCMWDVGKEALPRATESSGFFSWECRRDDDNHFPIAFRLFTSHRQFTLDLFPISFVLISLVGHRYGISNYAVWGGGGITNGGSVIQDQWVGTI